MRRTFGMMLVIVWSTGVMNAQTSEPKKKAKFVVVPSEQILVTTAEAPGCPLKFEQVKYLAALDGGGTPSFEVRNRGTKPIRSFTVGGTDWTMSWSEQFTKKLLLPGETVEGNNDVEIVNLSDQLREKLNLSGSMKSVLVLMVIKVEFADGSAYNAESTYKALQKYTEKLDNLIINCNLPRL